MRVTHGYFLFVCLFLQLFPGTKMVLTRPFPFSLQIVLISFSNTYRTDMQGRIDISPPTINTSLQTMIANVQKKQTQLQLQGEFF